MDNVDVVYCHRADVDTPIEETVRAMNHIINKGQAFYWGTSEWTAQQITEVGNCTNQFLSTRSTLRTIWLFVPSLNNVTKHLFRTLCGN